MTENHGRAFEADFTSIFGKNGYPKTTIEGCKSICFNNASRSYNYAALENGNGCMW